MTNSVLWRRKRLIILSLVLLAVFAVRPYMEWRNTTVYTVNMTTSLPNWLFAIKRTEYPQKGDYIAFRAMGNGYYPDDAIFIKQVLGVQGDKVKRDGLRFYINDQPAVLAKTLSSQGDPLEPGPIGIIPEGHFFVATEHKDGFDSRYALIGWVSPDQILGRAEPLL